MRYLTLLSDFGLEDVSLAVTKGILLREVPDALITDISHVSEPFQVQHAAYKLEASWQEFPEGTVHIVLFDIFSEPNPRLLLCKKDGHFFLAPDNGILPMALSDLSENIWECYELKVPDRFRDWVAACGKAAIVATEHDPSAVYLPTEMRVKPVHWKPVIQPNSIECHVVYIDRFGNVVLNLKQPLFEQVRQGRNFKLFYMRGEELNALHHHYSEVNMGNVLCRFNKSGFLEIAANRGNAAELLGLQLSYKKQLLYNTVKIFFE